MSRASVHASQHQKRSHCGCGACAAFWELWGYFKMGLRDEAANEAVRLARSGVGIHRGRPDCKVAVMVLARMRQEGFATESVA